MIPEVVTLPDCPAVATMCCRCTLGRQSLSLCEETGCGVRWQRAAVEDRAARDAKDAKEKENL
jgi:hypothetical protein